MLDLALAQVGRTREAVAQYRAALKLKPHNASARFNLANAEIKAGDLDAAIDACIRCWSPCLMMSGLESV
jgi:Flp pilus assembly protein TadD